MNTNHSMGREITQRKIFKKRAFWVGTYLGGPLVAGYLFIHNYKALGQENKVERTLWITVLSFIVFFGAILILREVVDLPKKLIPLIYTFIAYYLYKAQLDEETEDFINAGGPVYSWWRVIGVSLIGMFISLGVLFGVHFSFLF